MFRHLSLRTAQIAVLGGLIGAGLFALAYLKAQPAGPQAAGGPARGAGTPVIVAAAAPHSFSDVLEAIGTAAANESIVVTAKVTETVGAINFTDGQSVPQGHVIVELANREQSADLSGARASLNEAQEQLTRAQGLLASGTGTRQRLEAAQAARDEARARVGALEARLGDRVIRAPFAGVLGLRQASVGQLVRPGDPITTLDDISVVKVNFSVPEVFLGALQAGLPVEAEAAAYPGQTFRGAVTAVDTRVDPVTRAVSVRAEIPNADGRLKPGMLLGLRLFSNVREAVAVPELALVPVNDKVFVFVVGADGKAERRPVVTGARDDGLVEIRDGLQAGETVVSEGTNRVQPGMAVSPVPREPAAAESGAAPRSGS